MLLSPIEASIGFHCFCSHRNSAEKKAPHLWPVALFYHKSNFLFQWMHFFMDLLMATDHAAHKQCANGHDFRWMFRIDQAYLEPYLFPFSPLPASEVDLLQMRMAKNAEKIPQKNFAAFPRLSQVLNKRLSHLFSPHPNAFCIALCVRVIMARRTHKCA